MFGHIFINNLKALVRTKEVIFWTLLYPIALATFFFLAFGNLASAELFGTIDVAVVQDAHFERSTPLYAALSSVSDLDKDASENDVFRVALTDADTAARMLDDGEVSGIISYDGGVRLTVSGSGVDQTIIKGFLDGYLQSQSTVSQIIKDNPDAIGEGLIADIADRTGYVRENTGGNPDTTVIYFYSLLAMTCLLAATVGIQETIKVQADLSPLAARNNVAPVKKFKLFLSSVSAAVLLQLVIILLVLAYVVFVLGVDFGPKTGLVLLTCAVGCVTGIFFGTLVSAAVRRSEGIKYAVVISLTLLFSVLSGMMYAEMKYIVQQNVPLLAYINPVNLITDAFYALYYYDGLSRYLINILLLGCMGAAFAALTCLILRRQKYASI